MTRIYLQRTSRSWRKRTGITHNVVTGDGWALASFTSRREAIRWMKAVRS